MSFSLSASRLLGLALAVAVLGLALGAYAIGTGRSSPAQAAADGGEAEARGVDVTGVGTVTGTPDVLRFTIGVEVTGDSVEAALASANDTTARVIDVLTSHGIEDKDLQTANVTIRPRYDKDHRTITGYVAGENLNVKVRDLETAGAIVTDAVEAGGDAARLHGVAFLLEDNEALLRQARDAAFAEARAKAEQYAELAGRDLGSVLSVREDVRNQPPRPEAAGRAASLAAADQVPIQPGSTEVAVSVDVRWALD